MGRYKLGPQGTYFDPNDSGPDQASPDQIQQFQQTQQPVQPNTGYQPPTGGINPGGGNIRPVPLPPGTQFLPMPQLPMPGPYKSGPAWPGGGFTMPQTPIGERWWNRGRPPSSWTEMPPNDFGFPTGGLGQLPRQVLTPIGGIQSQGGPMSDPRWTNGTWGGSLQMLGPKALL